MARGAHLRRREPDHPGVAGVTVTDERTPHRQSGDEKLAAWAHFVEEASAYPSRYGYTQPQGLRLVTVGVDLLDIGAPPPTAQRDELGTLHLRSAWDGRSVNVEIEPDGASVMTVHGVDGSVTATHVRPPFEGWEPVK